MQRALQLRVTDCQCAHESIRRGERPVLRMNSGEGEGSHCDGGGGEEEAEAEGGGGVARASVSEEERGGGLKADELGRCEMKRMGWSCWWCCCCCLVPMTAPQAAAERGVGTAGGVKRRCCRHALYFDSERGDAGADVSSDGGRGGGRAEGGSSG